MKKLELKHVVSYLPYRLKVYDERQEDKIGEVYGITTQPDAFGDCFDIKDWSPIDFGKIENYKPILRPLSDITKVIEHNGQSFVPIDELQKQVGNSRTIYVNFDGELLFKGKNEYFIFGKMDVLDSYEMLFKWHFDVFGLIDAGLAIDINTLNK